jgi:cell cycle arrest protein BUB3
MGLFRNSKINSFPLPGYATASVEGRIAVEYFDPAPAIQEKKYAFKCHRQTIDDVDHVWPVNALAFHPTYNTFASGGSDATVSIWDHKVKKRLRQYTRYNAPVAALAFSADGARLAVGASYTWDAGEEGARTAERPSLFVREVGEEVKVRISVWLACYYMCTGPEHLSVFFLVAKGMGS